MATPNTAAASSDKSDVPAAADEQMNNPSVEDFLKGAADDRAEEWDWDDHSWGASGWNDGDRWRDHQWQGPRSWSNGREFDDYGRRTSWDTSWEGGSTETTASAHGGSWGYQGGRDDHDEEPHDPWADGRDGGPRGRDSRQRQQEGSWPEYVRDYNERGGEDNRVVWNGWQHYTRGSLAQRSDDRRVNGEFGGRTGGARASEKLAVPEFSGEDGEDVGNSARSYLRQVEAWRRLTHLAPHQQGLVLYKHLSGKAWVAAEELSVDALGQNDGVQYLLGWLRDRYLDLEVTRIGKAFSDMFRKLKRRSGQTVRDYNSEYDRLHARLRETGCRLPEECAAWLYVDRLNLEEGAELNLLASVGNQYSLGKLQKAAIIQDRGLREPWEATNGRGNKRPFTAHVTDNDDGNLRDSDDELEGLDEIPEEVAVAYMTYKSAKNRYRDQARSRGFQGETAPGGHATKPARSDDSDDRDEKIRLMKSRSFCASCGKKGHWHKDKECPNNKTGGTNEGPKDVKMCTIIPAQVLALRHVGGGGHLLAITDTACARTVAGMQWVQDYMDKLPPNAPKPKLLRECEAYRFGTGKIMYSSFYIVIRFRLGQKAVRLRTSVINGDIPLLVSRTVLSKLGMVYDIEQGTANFTKVGLSGFELLSTASGHPAIPIVPVVSDGEDDSTLPVEEPRLESREPYTAFAVGLSSRSSSMYHIYHDKKLDPAVKNMLTQCRLPRDVFMSWWKHCRVPGDFWIETECTWIRVHLTPRRSLFNPAVWGSSATLQKQMLLSSLGEIRVTEAVCCSSERWLEDVVDTWNQQAASEPTLPLLWIGRTILNKRSTPSHFPSPPLCLHGSHAMRPPPADQQDEQDPVGRGGGEVGTCGSQVLVPGGDQGHHHGAPGGAEREGRDHHDEEGESAHPPRAQGEGPVLEHRLPGRDHQGQSLEVGEGLSEHPGQRAHEDRPLSRQGVQGDTAQLRGLGGQRGEDQCVSGRRAGSVRALVRGEAAEEPGLRGQRLQQQPQRALSSHGELPGVILAGGVGPGRAPEGHEHERNPSIARREPPQRRGPRPPSRTWTTSRMRRRWRRSRSWRPASRSSRTRPGPSRATKGESGDARTKLCPRRLLW